MPLPNEIERLAEQYGGIRAYHGSPHDFDQFDISKVGTGEGAQAYGHGLYFAQREDVAKSYRDQTSPSARTSITAPNGEVVWNGLAGVQQPDYQTILKIADQLPGGDLARFVNPSIVRAWLDNPTRPLDPDVVFKNAYGDMHLGDLEPEARARIAERIKQAEPELSKFQIETDQPGRMYEANINAHPDTFLDWDKPLSGQSDFVQNALTDVAERLKQNREKYANIGEPTGAGIYESSLIAPGDYRDSAAASQALLQRGINGVRYLDQGSRAAGDGTSNYVVFDPKMIEIIRKYGLAPLIGGGAMTLAGNADAATHLIPAFEDRVAGKTGPGPETPLETAMRVGIMDVAGGSQIEDAALAYQAAKRGDWNALAGIGSSVLLGAVPMALGIRGGLPKGLWGNLIANEVEWNAARDAGAAQKIADEQGLTQSGEGIGLSDRSGYSTFPHQPPYQPSPPPLGVTPEREADYVSALDEILNRRVPIDEFQRQTLATNAGLPLGYFGDTRPLANDEILHELQQRFPDYHPTPAAAPQPGVSSPETPLSGNGIDIPFGAAAPYRGNPTPDPTLDPLFGEPNP